MVPAPALAAWACGNRFCLSWHAIDVKSDHNSADALDEHGSWDPVGAWGTAGGRIYSTAMGALILQTSNRYQRFHEE